MPILDLQTTGNLLAKSDFREHHFGGHKKTSRGANLKSCFSAISPDSGVPPIFGLQILNLREILHEIAFFPIFDRQLGQSYKGVLVFTRLRSSAPKTVL